MVGLINCNLSSDDLRALSDVDGLTILNLAGSAITDDCVEYILPLKRLDFLCVADSGISEEGFAYLRSGLNDKVRIEVISLDELLKSYDGFFGEGWSSRSLNNLR